MVRYRTHNPRVRALARRGAPGRGVGPSEPARRRDISRELLRIRVRKHQAGELAGGRATTPDRLAHEAEIAGLERKVGRLAMELDPLEKGRRSARRANGASSSVAPRADRHPRVRLSPDRIPSDFMGPVHCKHRHRLPKIWPMCLGRALN